MATRVINTSSFRRVGRKVSGPAEKIVTKETIVEKQPIVDVITIEKPGPMGSPGLQGLPGEMGIPGPAGPAPEHEINGNSIRFKNPDGTWGKWVELGSSSYFPGNAGYKYIHVNTSEFFVKDAGLSVGQNIIGVNYNGPVTVWLPAKIKKNKTITIKDESGMAGTNNITIKVNV